jgi:hypothetical protein
LFAVAVKSFRAGPTITIHFEDAIHLPTCPICDQNFCQLLVPAERSRTRCPR